MITTEKNNMYPEGVDYGEPCPICQRNRRAADNVGIPPEFCNADISKFGFERYAVDAGGIKKICKSFVNDFMKWEKAGKGLYIWSETAGSGKTFLACCLARSVSIKVNVSMRFVTAPDYITAVGNSYKRTENAEAVEVYKRCKILVLDDLGAEKAGDWQAQVLFELVDSRMKEGLITIYTSNLPQNQLKVSDRLYSRIAHTGFPLHLPEESIRDQNTKRENDEFIKMILG